ncbi:glutaredoxin family protein [Bacillus subtilis subsp. subtilis]|nr:glutaredoxin family protein [Bacillus subtilis subsp. subtilis]
MIAKLRVSDGALFYAVAGASHDCGATFSRVGGPVFTLFQRDDCHLCDQALAVLAQARVPGLDSVFIDDDGALEARYGLRVPVLRDAQGRELDWPFDLAAVQAWLGAP